MYLYTINKRKEIDNMDGNEHFELVREAKSIAILLEGDLQMNKYDESIIDGIRVIKRLLNQALKHKE